MTLLSPFIFIWIIIIIAAAWLLPRKRQPLGIAAITAVFMAYYVPISFFLLTLTTISSYYLMKHGKGKASISITAIGFVAAILVYYKIKGNVYWLSVSTEHLVPLGLSYYSFRQIHYIFESRKNKLPLHSFLDYVCYLFFFPTLFIGPIHRFPNFVRYLNRRRWDPKMTSQGLERILYGYVKIVVIANFVVGEKLFQLVNSVWFVHPNLAVYLDALQYGLNLYFQFSGYSDVAIGLSLIIGFKITENFNYPFLALNISDFWRRWHISLSDWCRDYVYFPIAAETRKPYLAIISSMLILGLWHAISLQYICWGLYHGIGIAFCHRFQRIKRAFPQITNKWILFSAKIISNFITMNYVIVGFVITKEPDMQAVFRIVKRCYLSLI